jgi:arsenate reductase
MKERVLFICTHNSARSQIAEGYLNARYGDRFESYSAGTEATRIKPWAITVMAEIGIDISQNRSKILEEFFGKSIDVVVSVCDTVYGTCPIFPGTKRTIHKSFTDPSLFSGLDEEVLEQFRRVRDEIIIWIDKEFG